MFSIIRSIQRRMEHEREGFEFATLVIRDEAVEQVFQ